MCSIYCMRKINSLGLGTVSFVLCVLALAGTTPVSGGSNPPARYISLAPSTTEILFALGLDEEIVGVSSFCDYPAKALDKQKVGDFSHPNIEIILSLKPDYIFCTGLEQAPVIDSLQRLNLKVYIGDPANMGELLITIQDIGKITHKEKEAQKLIEDMQGQLREISSKVDLVPLQNRPKVFIEIWHDPLTTFGKGSFVDELVSLAGGINIAHDAKRAYSIFSPEEVIKRNPDFIFLTYMGGKEKPADILAHRFGWKDIAAVKNKRVYNDIDENLLLRPGPRVVLGVKALYKRLYEKSSLTDGSKP